MDLPHAMSADKHFNAPGGHIPELLEDHGPDDMSAARSIGVIVMLLLVVCSVIAAVIITHQDRASSTTAPVATSAAP